ncbi:hypothetical protein QBC46DRAFT_409027 [Diplogelasinospora grovesii]|uniref:AMP-binding enzyme C-terminal domain-containing protein n=1 Tax=Diplogelasinospora grovesii TaxID=303347 RepID=A0AAN6N5M1_9PEZI|nr:hypothetical protein QBC46DRAFT_409027 [Diplogelasinospora grovesii]
MDFQPPSLVSVRKVEAEIGSLQLKEMPIKGKGFQVKTAEIKEVIRRHDSVADAAVVGVEDDNHDIAGERPLAFVSTTSQNKSSHPRQEFIFGRYSCEFEDMHLLLNGMGLRSGTSGATGATVRGTQEIGTAELLQG